MATKKSVHTQSVPFGLFQNTIPCCQPNPWSTSMNSEFPGFAGTLNITAMRIPPGLWKRERCFQSLLATKHHNPAGSMSTAPALRSQHGRRTAPSGLRRPLDFLPDTPGCPERLTRSPRPNRPALGSLLKAHPQKRDHPGVTGPRGWGRQAQEATSGPSRAEGKAGAEGGRSEKGGGVGMSVAGLTRGAEARGPSADTRPGSLLYPARGWLRLPLPAVKGREWARDPRAASPQHSPPRGDKGERGEGLQRLVSNARKETWTPLSRT